MKPSLQFPIRYLPKILDNNDRKKQIKMLVKSQQLYKKGEYYARDRLPSFTNKKSF